LSAAVHDSQYRILLPKCSTPKSSPELILSDFFRHVCLISCPRCCAVLGPVWYLILSPIYSSHIIMNLREYETWRNGSVIAEEQNQALSSGCVLLERNFKLRTFKLARCPRLSLQFSKGTKNQGSSLSKQWPKLPLDLRIWTQCKIVVLCSCYDLCCSTT